MNSVAIAAALSETPEVSLLKEAAVLESPPTPFRPPAIEQVRIENTNHCINKCIFCPREKMTRPNGIQTVNDFLLVLDRVEEYGGTFAGEVHLHGYGEPLLDRQLLEKVRELALRWPKASPTIVTTLGCSLPPQFLHDLVAAGMKRMIVSFYGGTPTDYKHLTQVDNFHQAFRNLVELAKVKKAFGPELSVLVQSSLRGLPNQKNDTGSRLSSFNEQLTNLGLDHTPFDIHNFGDGRDYVPAGRGFCEKAIRRHVLQVTWDLKVIPCCLDYNARVTLGDLRCQSLMEVLTSPAAKQFLQAHQAGRPDRYSICRNCSYRSRPSP